MWICSRISKWAGRPLQSHRHHALSSLGRSPSTARPIHFDVIHGGELWSQNFGVVVATNAPPEPRKYTLIKANYLREQLRLYVQVSSGDGGQVYKVAALGPLVSFSLPEEQVDRSVSCMCSGRPARNLSAT